MEKPKVELMALGTGKGATAIYTGECSSSCVLLINDKPALLIDIGLGVTKAFQKYFPSELIPPIYITHNHSDHSAELPVVLVVENAKRKSLQKEPLRVYAQREVKERLIKYRMHEMYSAAKDVIADFDFHDVPEYPYHLGDHHNDGDDRDRSSDSKLTVNNFDNNNNINNNENNNNNENDNNNNNNIKDNDDKDNERNQNRGQKRAHGGEEDKGGDNKEGNESEKLPTKKRKLTKEEDEKVLSIERKVLKEIDDRLSITCVRAIHSEICFGLFVYWENEKLFAYSGDSAYSSKYYEILAKFPIVILDGRRVVTSSSILEHASFQQIESSLFSHLIDCKLYITGYGGDNPSDLPSPPLLPLIPGQPIPLK